MTNDVTVKNAPLSSCRRTWPRVRVVTSTEQHPGQDDYFVEIAEAENEGASRVNGCDSRILRLQKIPR